MLTYTVCITYGIKHLLLVTILIRIYGVYFDVDKKCKADHNYFSEDLICTLTKVYCASYKYLTYRMFWIEFAELAVCHLYYIIKKYQKIIVLSRLVLS